MKELAHEEYQSNLGLPGWAGTRKVQPIWIYWSKRQWVAVASAGPYANLHLASNR